MVNILNGGKNVDFHGDVHDVLRTLAQDLHEDLMNIG